MRNEEVSRLITNLDRCKGLTAYQDTINSANLNLECFANYIHYHKQHYTRNLIYRCNQYLLMLVCWSEGQDAAIHDHANSECIMTCLSGRLHEVLYEMPQSMELGKHSPMPTKIGEDFLDSQQSSHINNTHGLHAISNLHSGNSVSLHLYIPNIGSCLVYDQLSQTYIEVPDSFHTAHDYDQALCN